MKRIHLEIALGTLFIIASSVILILMASEEPARLARYEVQQAASQIEFGAGVYEANCTSCHQVRGLNDDYTGAAVVSGSAPDLTHLMSRSTFAGSLFRLYAEADDDDIADLYRDLASEGTFNRVQLEAWLRDPPAEKPMYADAEQLGGELPRGMPNLQLDEDQIDQLVAYLLTLD